MNPDQNPLLTASPDARLVLVYNADEGVLAALADMLSKILRPASYPCSLCQLSYGPFAMRRKWRRYLAGLPIDRQFFHRQDFARAFPADRHPEIAGLQLPAILIEEKGRLEMLLPAEEMNQLNSVDELIWSTDQALRMKFDRTG